MVVIRLVVALAIAAIIGVADGSADDRPQLRIATEGAYPPFNSRTPQGELVGFDIDMAKALCAHMKMECVFVEQDWDGMIPGLIANRYDAIIASMAITEERKRKVAFSGKYYATRPALVVRRDSGIETATDADLAGRALGAQSGTTHANYVEAKFPSARLKLYPIPLAYQEELVNGRLEAAIDDQILLQSWIDDEAPACCKALIRLPVDTAINGEGIGIAVRKTSSDLKAGFDEAIAAIRADGTYKRINDTYFSFDVYGD